MSLTSLRPLIRDCLSTLIQTAGISSPRRWAKDRLSIATFHRVLPSELREQYPMPGLSVTPSEFAGLLEFFSRNFRCGPMTETFDRWRARSTTDKPLLAITFDDGQWDNYAYAMPLLERAGLKASFFIPVDSVNNAEALWHDRVGFSLAQALTSGKTLDELSPSQEVLAVGVGDRVEQIRLLIHAAKSLAPGPRGDWSQKIISEMGSSPLPDWARPMSWSEIQQLADSGHEIGSHSMTHSLLPQCDSDQLRREVVESREQLEAQIGCEITAFCYPNGDCDARTAEAVERAGYRCAVTTRWGTNALSEGSFELQRCDMHPGHVVDRKGQVSPARVSWRMSGIYLRPG